MSDEVTSDDLLRMIPDFLRHVAAIEDFDNQRVAQALIAADLDSVQQAGHGRLRLRFAGSFQKAGFLELEGRCRRLQHR